MTHDRQDPTRRSLLAAALLSPTLLQARPPQDLPAAWAALEARSGGRLGLAWLDTGSGQLLGHRADERFALCSTFKLLLAACVLAQVDAGRWQLDDWLRFGQADLVPHAPVIRQHLAAGRLPLVELAEAIQTTSDNVAANLLLRHLGGDQGPQALTRWLRQQGDTLTRIDRFEPQMNDVPLGELRDTTTPAAMARICARLLLGDVLKPASRERLVGWTKATRTGQRRLRAGLPQDWPAGDKTGTGWQPGQPDKINDVAIVWPPGRAPWLISAFYETAAPRQEPMQASDEAVLADAARLLLQSAAKPA